ncbi:hypothetical protein ACFVVX_02495 [Kitasatospora sp. NPDC058170]|uniref:hypothetical protein n=1 Tax=Kitasatospora sp. NPDC058170 TaxID=3346364 RepID=UPI0036DBCADB
MAERRYEHAPAHTLPGLLQRGRGLGARMAAEDPAAAAELVYGCIRWDWRWDSVDQRALYLARLVRDSAAPLGPVVKMLARGEGVRERATGVLELLALDGPGEAGDALRACAREGKRSVAALEETSREQAEVHNAALVELPADHGEAEDVPVLVAQLERDWAARRWCGPKRTAEGLRRLGPDARDAVSLLRRFWLWTPHSYERASYLEALAAIEPAGLESVHTECLWDCEAEARLLGIAHAPDGPEVRERLGYLRDDPMEEPGVRAAAGERLAALTG